MNSRENVKSAVLDKKITVVLVRPEHPENIGLAARAMKCTGFSKLRVVLEEDHLLEKAAKTAVHSTDILQNAFKFRNITESVKDFHAVFASTSKPRKNFSVISLDDAVKHILSYSPAVKIGLLFGNERTGLTGDELKHSNFRFTIPQASRQPSYNLSFAVLLTLFALFERRGEKVSSVHKDAFLSSEDQRQTILGILKKIEEKGFIHDTNREHTTERIFELFRRMNMTEKDRKLLLALFSQI
ncbi:MAG: RNA methyltransferase [Candidatus Aminicenantes bacterium]|nr:RNA methyltransferase [Candidatus Aminicenantes bacterium]